MKNENENKTNLLMLLVCGVAQMAHAYQRRKNDPEMPYSVHPTMVAVNALIPSEGKSIVTRCAALLHDVVEDCTVVDIQRTYEWLARETSPMPWWATMCGDVRKDLSTILDVCYFKAGLWDGSTYSDDRTPSIIFGYKVLNIVNQLTVPKGAHPDGYYAADDKPARKAWERSLGRMEKMSQEALCVMYADKLYNMRNPLPGTDPRKSMADYGEVFRNIIIVLSTKYWYSPLGEEIPDDVKEAIGLSSAE